MIHCLMGNEGKFHQYLDSCERMRYLRRTDVFNYGRSKFQHNRQIYRFYKKINNNRLGRVVSSTHRLSLEQVSLSGRSTTLEKIVSARIWATIFFFFAWSMILFKSFTRVYHFTSNKITKYRHKKLRKTKLGAQFWPLWSKFGSKIFFFHDFTSATSYTLVQAIIVCSFKEN